MDDKVLKYRQKIRRCRFCKYYKEKPGVFGPVSFCAAQKQYLQKNEADTCELYEIEDEDI